MSGLGVLHACRDRAAQLEIWLRRAGENLRAQRQAGDMQGGVEQQILTCQEMFLEIEQKVASLAAVGQQSSSPGMHQEAEALSRRLEQLKSSLVSFQRLLQERHGEERHSQEQPLPGPVTLQSQERPLEGERRRSSASLQEMLSSARGKLSRQNSLQQQRELEQELSEQRDLTKAIALQGGRARPRSRPEETPAPPPPRPPGAAQTPGDVAAGPSEGQVGAKWQHLQTRLATQLSALRDALQQEPAAQVPVQTGGDGPGPALHTAQELQSLTARLRELGQSAHSVLAQVSPSAEASSRLDEELYGVLSGLGLCLDRVGEWQLGPSGRSQEDARLQLLQLEGLTSDLACLDRELSSRRAELSGAEEPGLCLDALRARVPLLQSALSSRSGQLQARRERLDQYQIEIRKVHASLLHRKSVSLQTINGASGRSCADQLQVAAQLESELLPLESQVSALKEEGESLQIPAALIQEVAKMEDVLDSAWSSLRERRHELREGLHQERQFERLLEGLSGLVYAGKRRAAAPESSLVVHSIAEFRTCLEKHQKYFQNLAKHQAVMEHFCQRVPASLLQKHEQVWTDLRKEMTSLQWRALQRGTEMRSTLQTWSHFNESCRTLGQLLQELEGRIPSVGLVEESEERLRERLAVYQQIEGVLEERGAWLCRVVAQGRGLQGAVRCAGLEAAVTELEGKWLGVRGRVEQDRHRVEALRKHWNSFRRDSVALSVWLSSAMAQLKDWRQHSVTVPRDRDHIHGQLLRFLDFTKEVEARSALKASVIGTGEQLLQLKQTDMAALRTQLVTLEQSWAEVQAALPAIQEQLHQLLMDRVSSRDAMAELGDWIGATQGQIRQIEERSNSASDSGGITNLLNKYKEYKIEMSCRQLTVDWVNQSVLQTSSADVQGKRYEKTDFAEQLGALNRRWLELQGDLRCKIQELESRLKACTDGENKLQLVRSWVLAQRERLFWFERPHSRSLAERALRECQDTEEKLQLKCRELEELRRGGLSPGAVDKSGAHSVFVAQADDVSAACTALSQKLSQVQTSLRAAVQRWVEFEGLFGEVNLKSMETRCSLELLHHQPLLSQEALSSQVDRLQALQDEAEGGEAQWETLNQAFDGLKDVCSPAAVSLLFEELESARMRWTAVNQELTDERRRAGGLLQLWQKHQAFFADSAVLLDRHQEECQGLLSAVPAEESTADGVQGKIRAVATLQERTTSMQASAAQVLQASQELVVQMEPSAAAVVQSEGVQLSHRLAHLGTALSGRLRELQEELEQLQEFSTSLASLESHLKEVEGSVAGPQEPGAMQLSQTGLLQLSALSLDLERLNELSYAVPVSDVAARRLQILNRKWGLVSSRAVERCSELQGEMLRRSSFVQRCESWLAFLQSTEDRLAVAVAGSPPGLREQQRVHQRFQAEVSVGHQILHAVMAEALQMLERGEVEDRSDFILKLSQLREQWQGAVGRAQQRKGLVDGLLGQWQLYSSNLKKLRAFLSSTATQLPPDGSRGPCRLHQLRRDLEDMKHSELRFQRLHSTYIQTLESGGQLYCMADAPTQARLQGELSALQEDWETTHALLGKRRAVVDTVLQTWERCESSLAASAQRLQQIQHQAEQPLPQLLEELKTAEKVAKETEDSLEDWAHSLRQLSAMKTEASHYILTDDVILLQEQVEHLHSQWEELCLKVSLRKQEIADRLNAWIIFNEKNKELCEWLTQMENKVAHNADLSIEEMVEKLKKDCMEEINLFSENKTHLKQLGEQLIRASNKTKETEINDKLKDINDRWKHLFDHIENRVRKLKETLVVVQQLDKNMSNLRTWLSRVEAELAKPVVYSICDDDEIQRKLAEQQDLQRDIEQHTEGVASVLNLCDVLLHDADACANDAECDSIQQTTHSLDQRWRNICAMSMERRMKIEETWRLWCKFLDDYSRFEDWLKTAERTAANPNSAEVLYTSAKEELKKFEAFQRQVHERLTQLELLNKQYRRLARENRTDAASRLKLMVHEGNQRWDNLQRRVAAVLRRLKHFTSQREEFEGTRDGILVWLTEMDLQLTNVEHFSESDIEDKMRQLNGFQQEITLNTDKIDHLIVFGETLIQKSAALDAVVIEDELEELHTYCQEVFGRVARFHHRLTSRRPVVEEERDLSDRDTDLDEPSELQAVDWRGEKEGPVPSPGREGMCHLMPPPSGQERSGRETPVSVDSIPLEWDHTVDVGGSSSHEDEEDATFYSALSGKGEPPSWHSPEPTDGRKQRLQRELLQGLASVTPDTSTPYKPGYVKLMSECSGSLDSVKRVKLILNDEELPDEPGLTGLSAADKQSGVIERWELIQAQALSDELRIKQNLQQWQQLNSDLSDITAWLNGVQPQLEQLQKLESCSSIQDLENNIKQLKEMQKAFDRYKAVMISVNLSSRDFQQGGSAEEREMQDGLRTMNQGWVQACGGLERWEEGLQGALMQCQEFHETTHALLLWLARAESRRFALQLQAPGTEHAALQERRQTLLALEAELRERQTQLCPLQEISAQLLLEPGEEEGCEARERVHVIGNKLKLLLRQVSQDLLTLQDQLDCSPVASGDEADHGRAVAGDPLLQTKEAGAEAGAAGAQDPGGNRSAKRDVSPPRSFFYRVLRAAFPLHLLFLLLLVLACLVPLSEEDYSCTLSNNFARSFYPMLRYTNGPPPT